MLVSLNMGPQSEGIAKKINTKLDNIEFHCYPTISELVKDARLRHLAFSRIIINNQMFTNIEQEFAELNEFIKNDSSSTELVLMVIDQSKNGVIENWRDCLREFERVFNSPMYTPVKLPSLSLKTIQDLVVRDITELKVNYFDDFKKELEKSEGSSGSSGNENTVDNGGVSPQNGGTDSGVAGGNAGGAGTGEVAQNGGYSASDTPNSASLYINDPTLTGNASNWEEESYGDEDELSLGSLGSMHSDTGFLDDDEEENDEELQKFKEEHGVGSSGDGNQSKGNLENSECLPEGTVGADGVVRDAAGRVISKPNTNRVVSQPEVKGEVQQVVQRPAMETQRPAVEVQRPVVETQRPVENIPRPVENVQRPRQSSDETINCTNIDILVSLRSANTTQDIIDSSIQSVDEDHVSVLIIDADYREHRVLSFINLEKFYQRGCQQGINRNKVYTEDGVDIISNGYGYDINSNSLLRLLSSDLAKSYDMVYVDCPIDCLDVLPNSCLRSCNILLNPGKNYTDFISTSMQLTSREFISLENERLLFSKCLLDLEGDVQEDLNLVKDTCFFPNGSWLDRVGI